MELLSGWGLCVLDDAAGALPAAADRARLILARWQQTQEAAAEFLRSVQLFGPLEIPLAAATAQRRAAAALIQDGDRRRGVGLLTAAHRAADRLGAGPALRPAERGADRTG